MLTNGNLEFSAPLMLMELIDLNKPIKETRKGQKGTLVLLVKTALKEIFIV